MPGLEDPFDILPNERMFDNMITMTFVTPYGSLDIWFIPDGTSGYDDLRKGPSRSSVSA